MNKEIETLLSEQLSSWETAQNNYAALKRVRIKDVKVNGCLYRIQFKSVNASCVRPIFHRCKKAFLSENTTRYWSTHFLSFPST